MRWRPLTTLVAVAAAGALVWFVPHFDRTSSSGYWAAMALFAAAGLVLGIAQLHGRDGNPRATFFVVFVPVLIAAIWVLIGAQPGDDWFGRHVRSWSDRRCGRLQSALPLRLPGPASPRRLPRTPVPGLSNEIRIEALGLGKF